MTAAYTRGIRYAISMLLTHDTGPYEASTSLYPLPALVRDLIVTQHCRVIIKVAAHRCFHLKWKREYFIPDYSPTREWILA